MFKTIFSILLCILLIIVLVVLYLLYKGVKLEEISKNLHLLFNTSSHLTHSKSQSENDHKVVNNGNHSDSAYQLKELNKCISELSKRMDLLEQRYSKETDEVRLSVSKLKKEVDVVKSKVSNHLESNSAVQHCKVISKNNKTSREPVFPKKMFAQYADSLNPVGFREESLKESENGCCYLIKILSGKEASFSFIDNAELKKNAVNHST